MNPPEARVVGARLDEDFSSGTGEKGAESGVYDFPGLFPDDVTPGTLRSGRNNGFKRLSRE